ncbi:MAG TPA: dihydropteroate synthase [bacterium]|nr:dihydropteroate synthase [bacterium]
MTASRRRIADGFLLSGPGDPGRAFPRFFPAMHPDFVELSRRLKQGPLVMGILNVTPDSFSDGGLWLDPGAAVAHAQAMAEQGADLLDIGGESTRPGAPAVGLEEEWDRLLPVLRALRAAGGSLPWSVDTQKAEVARRAVAEGACLVNDVSALRADAAMPGVVAASGAGACLMHRLEAPSGAQWSPHEGQGSRYPGDGVSAAVLAFLKERLEDCAARGIAREALWLDPGLGFGKTVSDNLRLIKDLPLLAGLGRPLLVGPSRKSFVGAVAGGIPVEGRLAGTLAACSVALWQGASVLRVHDVKEAVQAVRMVGAIRAS